jgi:hypothetical protein
MSPRTRVLLGVWAIASTLSGVTLYLLATAPPGTPWWWLLDRLGL